jgi:molybdopterin-guanine dinucleotide biosynthesis protein MobB
VKPDPYLLCVTGLKNSGKTTVCTAVIAALVSRGYSVAALKSSHLTRLRLDHRDADSYALAESGAGFVLVQGPEESLILERGSRSFAEMLGRVPRGVEFIISEGGEARAADGVIVCLRELSAWQETLRVRRVPEDRILALAGPFVRSVADSSGEVPPDRVPSGSASSGQLASGPASPEQVRQGPASPDPGTFPHVPRIDVSTASGRQSLTEEVLKAAAPR